ncbi:hypothetical protein ADUPG1_010449, partial [Aduncisulcus paluster]
SKSSGSNNINKKKPPLPSSHGSTSSSHHTSSSSSSKPTSTDVTNAHGKSEVSSSTVPSDFAPASFTSNGMSSLLDQDPHASPMFQSFSNPDLPLGGSVLDSGSHGLMLPPPSNSTLGSSGHKLSLSPPSLPSHSHRCLSLPASPHHHHIHSKQPLIHSAHDSQVKIVMDGFISVPSSRHPSPEPSSSLLLGDIRGEHGLLASTSTGSFGSFHHIGGSSHDQGLRDVVDRDDAFSQSCSDILSSHAHSDAGVYNRDHHTDLDREPFTFDRPISFGSDINLHRGLGSDAGLSGSTLGMDHMSVGGGGVADGLFASNKPTSNSSIGAPSESIGLPPTTSNVSATLMGDNAPLRFGAGLDGDFSSSDNHMFFSFGGSR